MMVVVAVIMLVVITVVMMVITVVTTITIILVMVAVDDHASDCNGNHDTCGGNDRDNGDSHSDHRFEIF